MTSVFENAGLQNSDFSIFEKPNEWIRFDFISTPTLSDVDINLKLVNIGAQVGPGWVE
jgi:hypothetical protein